ncbi:MAG: hypothetical protein AVDCRST_MAG19-2972 [uncultured Thermomicrobiales bacterium]|uniref:Uncharacterized protein n=1 Tax=uncultured Thermomicrobiales bacterium TaxID=1645740 RepID=A0A6J4V9R4_9BACT|nr:MAG: hypothetical protein AVDCRST_MAG19-2972 [uncultured Thermomicrobiales bacterium]
MRAPSLVPGAGCARDGPGRAAATRRRAVRTLAYVAPAVVALGRAQGAQDAPSPQGQGPRQQEQEEVGAPSDRPTAATRATTGNEVTTSWIDIYRVEGGRIAQHWGLGDDHRVRRLDGRTLNIRLRRSRPPRSTLRKTPAPRAPVAVRATTESEEERPWATT